MSGVSALTIGEGRLERQVVKLADGRTFDLGTPGTRRHARRLRKLIRNRIRSESAFREAFSDHYTRRGRPRAC